MSRALPRGKSARVPGGGLDLIMETLRRRLEGIEESGGGSGGLRRCQPMFAKDERRCRGPSCDWGSQHKKRNDSSEMNLRVHRIKSLITLLEAFIPRLRRA
jgi:hypothetical protein